MRRLRSALWTTIAAAALLALGSCAPASSTSGSLVYGLTLAPTGLDPHLNASSELGIPLTSVYDTLVYLDGDSGQFVAGLASRWTVSDDGLTYTFFLRKDVKFHDGTRFDAQAVKANFDYIQNPDNHSQKAIFMLGPVQNVEVVDDFTVALHLSQPYAPLFDSLSQVYLGMASPAALAKWGPTDYQFHQVGTGPYRFVEYVPNDHITLSANPDYAWAPSIYHQPKAKVETITFRFFTDVATRALALEGGAADIVGEIPPTDAERLQASGKFEILPVPIPGQPLQYFFNTRLAPTDDLSVRLALVKGVDRPAIVKTVFGDLSPVAEGPLSANSLGFNAQAAFPSYDLQGAEKLLDDAGWALDAASGLRKRAGKPLELIVVVPPWGSNPEVAQLLRASWERLGAQVRLEAVAGFGQLKESQASGEYHLIGLNFFGTDPDQLRPFFSSSGIYSWSNYRSAALDSQLEQASQVTHDLPERLRLYATISQEIRDQVLLLPIRDYVNLVVANSRVRNLRFSAQGWFPLLIDLQLAP